MITAEQEERLTFLEMMGVDCTRYRTTPPVLALSEAILSPSEFKQRASYMNPRRHASVLAAMAMATMGCTVFTTGHSQIDHDVTPCDREHYYDDDGHRIRSTRPRSRESLEALCVANAEAYRVKKQLFSAAEQRRIRKQQRNLRNAGK